MNTPSPAQFAGNKKPEAPQPKRIIRTHPEHLTHRPFEVLSTLGGTK
jgi:hypothetical protein